jgi:hypothetical protein
MSKKPYRFPHALGVDSAVSRIESGLGDIAREYSLTVQRKSRTDFFLHRMGADITVEITNDCVNVTVDLAWVVERTGIRIKIEEGINSRLPPLLR